MIELLRCKGAIAVGCTLIDGFIKVGILGVEAGDVDTPATLLGAGGATYPVLLPPKGVYYRALLEILPDAPTL